MKTRFLKLVSGILSLVLLLGTTGCVLTPTNKNMDIQAVTELLLTQVAFDTPLSDTEEDGSLYFPDLPEGASVKLYMGSGYFADELAVITLAAESDASKALISADKHLEQKHEQFSSYIPEELPKISDAVIWSSGLYVIVCITSDTATAEAILKNPDSFIGTTANATTDTTAETTQLPTETTVETIPEETTPVDTTPSETTPVETTPAETTPAETTPVETTPVETTPSETTTPVETTEPAPFDPTVHYYKSGVIRVGNMAYEIVYHIPSAVTQYAQTLNAAKEALGDGIQVYSMLIPTSIGVVLPEESKALCPDYVDQAVIINNVSSQLSESIQQVDVFHKLLAHKDEYLYFRTDYHWNGPAAYYAYEAFCEQKGITPYTMEQREQLVFDGYLGYLYWNSTGKDPILKENADTVYAYNPATAGVTMTYTDKNGNRYGYPIIADVTEWSASSKYMCFAAGDQPFAEFNNPNITDGSACIVVKESFGNALMSYVVDHYSTVYEIDYRYWTGNLADFAKTHGVTDVIFANNLSMVRNNYLIGKLGGILD